MAQRQSFCEKVFTYIALRVVQYLFPKMAAALPSVAAAVGKIGFEALAQNYFSQPIVIDEVEAEKTAYEVLRRLIPEWDEHVPSLDGFWDIPRT